MAKKHLSIKESRNPLQPIKPLIAQKDSINNIDVVYQNAFDSLSYFTTENVPITYESLKKEVKALEKIHAQSFLILSHRLKIIRDQELYKEDGYQDFKSFIESELDITRSVVYSYISVLEIFGVLPAGHGDLKITSLVKLIPYVKEFPEDKEELLLKASELSRRDLETYLREHYGSSKQEKELSVISEKLLKHKSWYESLEDLFSHNSFLRPNMKLKTIDEQLVALANYRALLSPKDPDNKKLKDILLD